MQFQTTIPTVLFMIHNDAFHDLQLNEHDTFRRPRHPSLFTTATTTTLCTIHFNKQDPFHSLPLFLNFWKSTSTEGQTRKTPTEDGNKRICTQKMPADQDMRRCQGKKALANSGCVQPVDEKCIWEFFAVKACEDRQEHRAPNIQGRNTDKNTSLHTPGTSCSWECGAYDGIPQCLGARLSRRLPGDPDFYKIDSSDLCASAAADARLARVFALLQKHTETLHREEPLRKDKNYQLVRPLLVGHLIDLRTPSNAAPDCQRVHYRSRARAQSRYGHTCRKLQPPY